MLDLVSFGGEDADRKLADVFFGSGYPRFSTSWLRFLQASRPKTTPWRP